MSLPVSAHGAASSSKMTTPSTAAKKASVARVAPFSSLFGPYTISNKNSTSELAKSIKEETPTPSPPGTTYRVKGIYIDAPDKVVDLDYRGTREQTKQAIQGLIDDAREGTYTTVVGMTERVSGSQCNVKVADDGMSFEIFPVGWEGWTAKIWAVVDEEEAGKEKVVKEKAVKKKDVKREPTIKEENKE